MIKDEDGTWQAVSWDKALAHAAQKLAAIRDAGNAGAIAAVTGDERGMVPGLFQRLTTVLGSGNFYTMDSMEKGWRKLVDTVNGVSADVGFDLENSDHILSFGSGFIEGWGAPVYNFQVSAKRKETGAQLVQIEARLSNTAAAADRWVAVKPGTEADLALGICSVLITAGRFDTGLMKTGYTGLQGLCRHGQGSLCPGPGGPDYRCGRGHHPVPGHGLCRCQETRCHCRKGQGQYRRQYP